MRLVTWNCNGALRRKYGLLDALDADILVIQECEDPAQSGAEYQAWAGKHAWIGHGRSKGIGIFPRREQSIEQLAWLDGGFEMFLPVRVGGTVDVLGVWTQQSNSSKSSYIGQFWHYLQAHKTALGVNTIIAGDFNSNTIWDKPRRVWNHSACVRELDELGFFSLYHQATGEAQGQEKHPTFCLHRNPTKPYHIDYVFAHKDRLNGRSPRTQVSNSADWLSLSDHFPVIADL